MTDRIALANAKSIDIHAHAVLAGSMGKAGAYGPEIGYTESGLPWFRVGDYRLDGVRYEGSPFMDTALVSPIWTLPASIFRCCHESADLLSSY